MSQYKIIQPIAQATSLKPAKTLQLNLSPTQHQPAPSTTQMSMISMASPRMPAWDGPYKLMLKVLTGSLKGISEKQGLELYPVVEFQRSGSTQVRKIQGSCARKSAEQYLKGGEIEVEVEWNWPIDLYYGGEVIHTNTAGNDTLQIYLYYGHKLFGDTGAFPLRYLVDGSRKATPRMNVTHNGVLVGTVHIEIQQIKRNQPANKQLFEPGCLKIVLKEAILLNSKEASPGNLMAKLQYQDLKTYNSKVSRTFLWKELAPKVMHIWNEEFDFPIKQKHLVSNTIRLTLYNDDKIGPVEVGSEEFCFPLFFYNGHGIKDHFYVFKNDLAVGKVLLHTTFEPYPPQALVREPTPPQLAPKDSLLMDEIESLKKKKKPRKKRSKPKPEWNNRFWVDGIKNLDKTHPYYKVYFDSPNQRGSIGEHSYSDTTSRLPKENSHSPRLKQDSTLGQDLLNKSLEGSHQNGFGRFDTLNQLTQNAKQNYTKHHTELNHNNIQLNQPSIDQNEYHQFIQTIQPVNTQTRKRAKPQVFATETASTMSFGNQSRKTQPIRNELSQKRLSQHFTQPRNTSISSSHGSVTFRSRSQAKRHLSPTMQAMQYGNPLLSKQHTPYLSPKMVQQFAAPINALARQFQWVRSPRTGKFVTHTRLQQQEQRQLNPEGNMLPTIKKRQKHQRFSSMQPSVVKQAIKSVTNRSPATTFYGVTQQNRTPMTMAANTTFSDASRLDHSMESPLPQYYHQYYVLTPPNQQSRIKTQGRMSRKVINSTTEDSDQVVLSSQGFTKNMRRMLRAQQVMGEAQIPQTYVSKRGFNEWTHGGQVKTVSSYGGNFSNNYYDSYQQYF